MATTIVFKFANGDEVEDTITGFKGIIIGSTQWLNGCMRYLVQPQKLQEGKTVPAESFDEEQLKLVKAVKVPAAPKEKKNPGGPFPNPTRR